MPRELIPLLIPLIIIQLSVQVAALISVGRKDTRRIRFESKIVWVLIIIFGSLLGSIAYFIFGGNPNDNSSSQD